MVKFDDMGEAGEAETARLNYEMKWRRQDLEYGPYFICGEFLVGNSGMTINVVCLRDGSQLRGNLHFTPEYEATANSEKSCQSGCTFQGAMGAVVEYFEQFATTSKPLMPRYLQWITNQRMDAYALKTLGREAYRRIQFPEKLEKGEVAAQIDLQAICDNQELKDYLLRMKGIALGADYQVRWGAD
jgi:hypothetical protein